MYLARLLRGWFITGASASTSPGTESFRNATWQHFGKPGGQAALYQSSSYQPFLLSMKLLMCCFLSFFPLQSGCSLNAGSSINCAPFSLLPGEISLSNLTFGVLFFSLTEAIAVVKAVIISIFLSCNIEASGNYLVSHNRAHMRDSTVYYSCCAHCV